MLFWGTGLHPVWWLTWIAPLPILLVAQRASGWGAFCGAALAWYVGSLNLWHYLLSNFATLPLVVVFSAVPACLFGFDVLLYRSFLRRGAPYRAALAFPAFWVTFEYLYNVASPNATFGNLAYTQMDFLPVVQVASLAGIWGISFCLFLFPALVAQLLRPGWRMRDRARFAIVAALFLAAVIGYGLWRLAAPPGMPLNPVTVAMMATGVDTPYPRDDRAALQLLRDYFEKARSIAPRNGIVVLPEKIAIVSDDAIAQVDALFASGAATTGASFLVGVDRGTAAKRFNEARLYSPGGGPPIIYDKHHMVPGLESVDQPGTAIMVLNRPSGVWGIQICKDLDFPSLSRQYGARGAGLLLVPAWDFTADAWLHGRMAVLRGVESGFTIARAAKQGLLTVSDDRGRILAEADAATVRVAHLAAAAPVRHDDTLYARWGDWFAWLNLAGLLALLLSLAKRRKREAPAEN
jgi:apolipoprotein N-acyltransferase